MKGNSRKNSKGKPKDHMKQGACDRKADRVIKPECIKGTDDNGNFYGSYEELASLQLLWRGRWYEANRLWWDEGYGGKSDEEVMVGDEGAELDGQEGLDFLDRLLESSTSCGLKPGQANAIDAGAGVGRVTKHILLKRYATVRLVESNPGWSKRSKVYLGRKRAGRCRFTCSTLQDLCAYDFEAWGLGTKGADLIWLQWTLQYMTDVDAIHSLKTLATGLVSNGFLVVKENRPFGKARLDRFQIETPEHSGRYDICRPDVHHRFLFQRAGLQIDMTEEGVETNTYAVSCCKL